MTVVAAIVGQVSIVSELLRPFSGLPSRSNLLKMSYCPRTFGRTLLWSEAYLSKMHRLVLHFVIWTLAADNAMPRSDLHWLMSVE